MGEWRGWNGKYDGKPRPLTGSLLLAVGLAVVLWVRLPGESVALVLSRSVVAGVIGIGFGLAACFIDLTFRRHFPTDASAEGDRRRRRYRLKHVGSVMLVLLGMELTFWALQYGADMSLVLLFSFFGTLIAAGFKGHRRPSLPKRPDIQASTA
jgi:hypothetical protein